MMKRAWLAGASVLLLAACASPDTEAPTQAAETETAAAAFDLPHEKFVLDNGLEVVLHVDRSDPIVAFSTVVHVGSNRERPGRTGFAHFFEHMAFNDSENVPRGWNRKAIPEWGGERNGGTWSDGTIYYEVVPKDAVDKILWIDSDRLGYMINTVTQAALEREKQVVKNEKRERVDNAAYGFTSEVIRKALYPADHPYSWTVIGQLEDLQAATLTDLREFYDQYYGASNATLAIAGDFDPAEMRAKVEHWFGEIRRGPEVEMLEPRPVSLAETKSLYWEDNFATLPELRMTYPTVESFHPDEVPLRVLGALLGGSKSSPLYEIVVEEERLAPGTSAYNSSQEIAGEFVIRVRANEGVDLDTVRAAIDAAFARFETEGIDPLDLQRIKAEQETDLYASVSTVLGKANQLATGNEFAGDPAYLVREAALLDAVTADDVMRVYREYIADRPHVATSFVPAGAPDLALADAVEAEVQVEEVRADNEAEEVSQGEVADFEKTPTRIDRSEPPFGELPLFEMPDIYEAQLSNGTRLLGIESTETPIVTFDISIDGGAFADPEGARGRMALLAALMNEGTASMTAAEFERAAGLLGASISVGATDEDLIVSVTTLARNFEKTRDLVLELIERPRLEEDAFAKVKQATLTDIAGRAARPATIANMAFYEQLYGADHPAGMPISGDAASVGALSLADLQAAHDQLLRSTARLHVVGDLPSDRARAGLAPLAGLFAGGDIADQDVPLDDAMRSSRVYFIDVPGSKQSVLYVGRVTVPSGDPEHVLIDFTNEKLGGGISGDLAQTLRIEKGYTYGAYSRIGNGPYPQPWSASTSVRANATQASLEIIRDMIDSYGAEFSEEDAEITRLKVVKDNTRAYESLGAKLGMLRTISRYGRPLDYLERNQATLLDMEAADFAAVAEKWLDEDEMIYIVVGDGATQLGPVRDFAGGEVRILDVPGTE
jgi:zinc protease